MEEMASLWSYQETMDELKQRLLYSTIELERLKAESSEEMRKNREYVKQLVQLLKVAWKERDEARDQLQKLLGKAMPPGIFSHVQADQSPLLMPTNANSGITESNSLSETYNTQGSSPVESLLDAVSSPDILNNNAVDSSTMIRNNLVPATVPIVDQATLAIDSLVKGKALPQKGKLLQAVLEAGPLLQTLLVAGPLPRWRNPPQLKAFHIPPVSIRSCEADIVTHQNPAASSRSLSQLCFENPGASSQMSLTPMLNFGCVPPGACLGSQRLISTGSNVANSYTHLEKRQRLQ